MERTRSAASRRHATPRSKDRGHSRHARAGFIQLALLLLIVAVDTPARAQTQRSDWVQLRGENDTRVASLKAAAAPSVGGTVANPLALVSVQLHTDDSGNQVVVGEVRNDTATSLSFAQARFTFVSSGGSAVGSDYAYVWGTSNARFPLGIYSSVLAPGGIGFFRLWTDVPASQVATYQFTSEAETFVFSSAFSAVRLSAPVSLSPNALGGTDYVTTVANDGNMTAYLTRVAMAGHLGGNLNDVDFAYALGSNVQVPCTGEASPAGVAPKGSGAVSGAFRWPVGSIARHLIEWQETGVTPPVHAFAAPGGSGSFTAIRGCGWTAQSSDAWITITSGQSSASSEPGTIVYTVAPNATGAFRRGTIMVSGVPFTIEQSAGSQPCSYALDRTVTAVGASGGSETVVATASDAGCEATAVSHANWIVVQSGSAVQGSGSIQLQVSANPGAARSGSVTIAGHTFVVNQAAASLPPTSINFTEYFAEGATSEFFETFIALLNVETTASAAQLRFQKGDGSTVVHPITVPALTRRTVRIKDVVGMEAAEFSTVIESERRLVADRTMTWDASGYGSHTERSVAAPSTVWYLAEGATHSGFDLFYLVQNPNDQAATVRIKYLLPAGAPIEKDYLVAARSRFNIWVDADDPRLADTDVSAVITTTLPTIVERAMYLSAPGRVFNAGHESAGITAPATEWFLAEGATGEFFDLFVLIANPGNVDAAVTATFLLPDGTSVVQSFTAAANSRANLWVDTLDPRLVDTAVSTIITSTNGVPIIVERAMWWPGPTAATWSEAHNSAGLTSTGRRWALAEGEAGGSRDTETYILIANRGPADTAQVTLYFEDGTTATKSIALPASSRTNVAVALEFPSAVGRRFGAIVEASSPTAQIAVERAMYSNAEGAFWAAGTNATATKLQ